MIYIIYNISYIIYQILGDGWTQISVCLPTAALVSLLALLSFVYSFCCCIWTQRLGVFIFLDFSSQRIEHSLHTPYFEYWKAGLSVWILSLKIFHIFHPYSRHLGRKNTIWDIWELFSIYLGCKKYLGFGKKLGNIPLIFKTPRKENLISK